MIDEYIIDYDDYIGIGAGSVSIYKGNFFVNSFSVNKYCEIIETGNFPVIGWRRLSDKEQKYYYLLTKLFGTSIHADKFRSRFSTRIERALGLELLALRALRMIEGNKNIQLTRRGFYPISVMMREFFTALNNLREVYIEKQM